MNLHMRLFVVLLLITPCFSHADTVQLRGEDTPMQGEILSGSIDGLRLLHPDFETGSVLLPWSTIQAFTSSKARPSLEAFLTQGEALWRAKHRLLRGDVHLAQDVFIHALPSYIQSSSADAQLVFEGALRCALAQGNVQDAIEPWLVLVPLRIAGSESPFPTLIPVIDSETMLCPHLPLVSTVRKRLSHEQQALIFAGSSGNGPVFAKRILALIAGDKEALNSLQEDLPTLPRWQQIWTNYFTGIVLLEETQNAELRLQGQLALAFIASLPQEASPWLSGAALVQLAQSFQSEGDVETAEKMMFEVERRYPTHPLLHLDQQN
ncbi:MAG: hypothetical protein P8N28_02415 [Phycisphaerales bacterium]|nr:hypothetical protein [Phycisphaerales bacterium]